MHRRLALRPSRVGCSGWNYDSWRGVVYPPGPGAGHWLERYAELFDTVEVNTTFYRLLIEAEQLGPVLWLLPENFHRDDKRLAGALALLPPGRHAFEFRHPSWFTPEVYELLREHDTALVIGDHPDRPFQSYELTATWTYVRFHHGRRGRRGNYSERELGAWARRLQGWREQSEVLAYFNNDWEAFAPKNAAMLREQLERVTEATRSAA